MALIAYADESGHSADLTCRHIGIAAVLAAPEASARLTDEWARLLRKAGVDHFHMNEFAHSHGPFIGWTEDRRRELLGPLLDAVVAVRPSIFGAVMSLGDWRALEPTEQRFFIDPWFPCLQECGYLSAAHGSTVGQATVDFVFSQQDEFQGRARPLWEIMRRRGDPFTALGEFRFGNMREEIPLQVADLATYEMVLAHDHVAGGATRVRYPFQRLQECDHYFRYIDAAYLAAQVAGARAQT